MARTVRYTVEQKQKMKERALALKEKGVTQAATARDLGIDVKTLVALFKGKPAAKSPKKISQKAKMAGKKPGAPKAFRYTPEQKQEIRRRAKQMRAEGQSQKAVAEELGIAVQTLVRFLGSKAATKAAKAKVAKGPRPAGRGPSDPLTKLARMRERFEELTQQVSRLNKEKARLQKEMKGVYKVLGKDLLGNRGKE